MKQLINPLTSLKGSQLGGKSYNPSLTILTGLILASLVFSTSSYAALSATTAKEIKGSEPYFKLVSNGATFTSTDELLGFVLDTASGTTTYTYLDNGSTITVPTGTKLTDIKPLFTPTAASTYQQLSGLLGTYFTVEDNDGDASITTNTFALGEMKIQLLRDGKAIAPTNTLLSSCSSYQLKIDINQGAGIDKVTAKTTYGYPDKKEYTGNTSATYNLISADAKICYIQTKDMTVFSSQNSTNSRFPYVSATNPGGYNPAVWDYDNTLPAAQRHKGFNVTKLSVDYPTTGFKGAELTFLGSGNNQGLYQCDVSVSAGGTLWVSKGGSNGCTLTYTSSGRPAGDITVTLKTNETTPITLDTYTIKAPIKWAEAGNPALVTGTSYATSVIPYNQINTFTGRYLAAESCGFSSSLTGPTHHAAAGAKFFSIKDLSNAPQADTNYYIYNGAAWVLFNANGTGAPPTTGGRYSRDADGTFMDEWGYVMNYTSSPWSASGTFWAAEAYSSYLQYSFYTYGDVRWTGPTTSNVGAVCKR